MEQLTYHYDTFLIHFPSRYLYFTFLIVSVCWTGNAVKKKQSRKRLIIQQPSNGGQDCHEVLEEERDCELPKVCPGFRWFKKQKNTTVTNADVKSDTWLIRTEDLYDIHIFYQIINGKYWFRGLNNMAVFNLKSDKIFKYRRASLFIFISASQNKTPKIKQNFSYLSLMLFSILK